MPKPRRKRPYATHEPRIAWAAAPSWPWSRPSADWTARGSTGSMPRASGLMDIVDLFAATATDWREGPTAGS